MVYPISIITAEMNLPMAVTGVMSPYPTVVIVTIAQYILLGILLKPEPGTSPSIMYNTDGYLRFLYTRVRGGHFAIGGFFDDEWQYRLMASYRISLGTPFIPARSTYRQGAMLIECRYTPQRLKGWSFCGAVAVDAGNMTGDNVGVSLSVVKSGSLFRFKKSDTHK